MVAKKICRFCSEVSNRIIVLGFLVQIVLGVLWMGSAFVGDYVSGKGIVCVVQMLLLGGTIYFVSPQLSTKKRLFLSLAVLTFPMMMQSFLRMEFRLIGAVLLLLGLGIVRRWKGAIGIWGKKHFAPVMLCLVVSGSFAISYGQLKEYDLLTRLAGRIVWTDLYARYGELSDEERKFVPYWDMVEASEDSLGMETVLVPSMVEKFGEKKSRELLLRMMQMSVKKNKKNLIKEIFWDESGYVLSPVVVMLQWKGRGYESYTGINCRELLLPAPKLGDFYMRYSYCLFAIALCLRIFCWIVQGAKIKKGMLVYAAVISMLLSGIYTLSGAGKMDYKNTLFILCLWLLFIVNGEEDTVDEQEK